mgnify:CR=1 FL=1
MSISCPDCGEDGRASGTRHIKYRNVQRRIRTCPNGHKFITIEHVEEKEHRKSTLPVNFRPDGRATVHLHCRC